MREIAVLSGEVTRDRVEQIRAQMAMQVADGKWMILRTHRNAAAYDLLAFIDQHLPRNTEGTS